MTQVGAMSGAYSGFLVERLYSVFEAAGQSSEGSKPTPAPPVEPPLPNPGVPHIWAGPLPDRGGQAGAEGGEIVSAVDELRHESFAYDASALVNAAQHAGYVIAATDDTGQDGLWTGGAGTDRFVFATSGDGIDNIVDFNAADFDALRFQAFGAVVAEALAIGAEPGRTLPDAPAEPYDPLGVHRAHDSSGVTHHTGLSGFWF